LQGTWLIGHGFGVRFGWPFGFCRQEYGSAFLTMPLDGIVGLGFQDLVNVNGKALMETLVETLFALLAVAPGGSGDWGTKKN